MRKKRARWTVCERLGHVSARARGSEDGEEGEHEREEGDLDPKDFVWLGEGVGDGGWESVEDEAKVEGSAGYN